MISIICILLIVSCCLIVKLNEFDFEKKKKRFVGQIIHGDWQIDHFHINNYDFSYFEIIQKKLNLSDVYSLNNGDKEQVIKIIEAFKKNLSEKYFSDRLVLPKPKYRISDNEFLMLSLYLFLDENTSSTYFCKEPMHKNTVAYKSYGFNEYDATYSVTEFAIIVYKLLYIAYVYCQNSEALNPKGNIFNNANKEYIEKLINTETICISCYRP